jgi:hypothetical protein
MHEGCAQLTDWHYISAPLRLRVKKLKILQKMPEN